MPGTFPARLAGHGLALSLRLQAADFIMTGLIRAGFAVASCAALTVTAAAQLTGRAFDPLGTLSPGHRPAIDAGRAAVDVVREPDIDLAVAGAVRTTADGDRLFAWYREVEQLQRGVYVPVLQRLSDPPRIEDLASLVLDESEVEDLRDCRPGDCDLKLAAGEIMQIHRAIDGAGRQWTRAAQDAFRRVLLARARAFQTRGFSGTPPYDDQRERVVAADEFAVLLNGCSLAGLGRKAVLDSLRRYPRFRGHETFLFWSKDLLGDAKPIIGITAVTLLPESPAGDPPIVASTQVYASHYINASLSLTGVVPARDGASRYLVYGRCTRTDAFGGPFGGFIRRMVQKRIRKEGPPVLDSLRLKLESGPPPSRGRGTAVPRINPGGA